jgi:hypothetical protein
MLRGKLAKAAPMTFETVVECPQAGKQALAAEALGRGQGNGRGHAVRFSSQHDGAKFLPGLVERGLRR